MSQSVLTTVGGSIYFKLLSHIHLTDPDIFHNIYRKTQKGASEPTSHNAPVQIVYLAIHRVISCWLIITKLEVLIVLYKSSPVCVVLLT